MSFKKIIKAIHAGRRILISTHIHPDPDALASELALAFYLKGKGKTVSVINDERVPHRFSFLPGVNQIHTLEGQTNADYDLAIIVDCGELNRIGEVAKLLKRGVPILNIDHHITNDRFGTLNLVVAKASSTSEVIFDLFQRLRCRLTRDMAILLYIGIMTDTGSFRYENTSGRTHTIAGKLMKFHFSVTRLYQKLYECVPLTDLKNFMTVVENLETLYGGKVICVTLTEKTVARFSQDFDLRDKIFQFLRTVKGVEVIVVFTQEKGRETRVNFRSQSTVDVAQLARSFSGGGHSRASGCLVKGNIKAVRRTILQRLGTLL